MKRSSIRHICTRTTGILVLSVAALSFAGVSSAATKPVANKRPPLIITNDPLPPELRSKIYNKPRRAPAIDARQVLGPDYYSDSGETIVGRKVDGLRNELFSLQGTLSKQSDHLAALETGGQTQAATYYASIATISTQLQSGTTPGNPRLVKRLSTARDNLERLSGNISGLNDMAIALSHSASVAAFLLESTRATYGLSGAIEEDHVRLAQMEDAISNTLVVIDRLLNNVNDDITRTVAYLSTERGNLRTLALAVTTGDLIGKSLSNRPFSRAKAASFSGGSLAAANPAAGMASATVPDSPRPLVKIRFDRPNVSYEQPVYMAVNEALARYPDARFELVAVHPDAGNAAETAIESTRARRNAEKVLRSLTQMGLGLDRIDLSYAPSDEASSNEVHLYVR